jgi:CheY-like chemotaxis protein
MSDKKILIVDDDIRNTFALTAVLKAKGYNCVSTAAASEAIDMVSKDQAIGIVLLDMMMPEMDGYEAIPILKQTAPAIPIIAVTAQAMVGDKEKCLEAGASDYISKPVDIDMLMSVLDIHLKH